jgi:ABC-type antimicrobial peptide transport system permease subunit
VIINEALAQQHFPGVDPVGRSITILSTMHAIVGVARSTRHFGPDQAAPPEVYVPLAQNPSPFAHVLISAVDLPPGLLSDAVRAIDPYLVAPPLQPFRNYVRNWFAPLRLQMIVLGLFAGVGILLATLGIYALVAYVVSNGRREIGIRLALGERSTLVFRRVLRHGFGLTAIGIALGTVAAYVTRDLMSQFATGSVLEPPIVLGVAALIACIALLASIVPARRAIAVDPIVTLRAD